MYCLLGKVVCELLTAPSELAERHTENYAKHETVLGKPKLQSMGSDLIVYDLTIRLHHMTGGVNTLYDELLSAQKSQKAQALIFGYSDFKGYFVITNLESNILITDQRGNVLAREIHLSLQEFVGEESQDVLGAALQLGGMSPLGAILPTGIVGAMSTARQLVSQGVKIYRSTMAVIDKVRRTINHVKNIIDNPSLVMAFLPGLLDELSGAIGPLSGLFDGKSFFDDFAKVLPSVKMFTQLMTNTLRDIRYINDIVGSIIQQGDYANNDWLDLSLQRLVNIEIKGELLEPVTSDMLAWVALREDDEVIHVDALS